MNEPSTAPIPIVQPTRTAQPVGERQVLVFEWIVAMLVVLDHLDYDNASDRAREILVDDFGVDAAVATRLAELAYDRLYPPIPAWFGPES